MADAYFGHELHMKRVKPLGFGAFPSFMPDFLTHESDFPTDTI